MPDSYNDRSPTPSASPKPARTATASPAIDATPVGGTRAGGTDNLRATGATLQASDSRAKTSPLRATRVPVDTFNPVGV